MKKDDKVFEVLVEIIRNFMDNGDKNIQELEKSIVESLIAKGYVMEEINDLLDGVFNLMNLDNKEFTLRLLTEEEYNDTLIKVSDGSIGNLDLLEIDLNRSCWIDDSSTNMSKKTISGSLSNVVNVDAKSRTVSYRPVLELINIGEEPYRNKISTFYSETALELPC